MCDAVWAGIWAVIIIIIIIPFFGQKTIVIIVPGLVGRGRHYGMTSQAVACWVTVAGLKLPFPVFPMCVW